jgi:hypothetical protein
MPSLNASWSRRAKAMSLRGRSAPDGRLEERLIWMVGSPRTGSTWLLNILGLHPRIRAMDEPLIGAHLGLGLGSLVAMESSGPDPEQARVIDRYAEHDDYFFSDRYQDAWLPQLRALLLSRLGAQFRAIGGEPANDYLVLKEPHGSEGADVLLRALPRSRVLSLVRDGRDVVDSALDGLRPGAWAADVATVEDTADARAKFLDGYARLWVLRTRTVLSALHRAGERGRLVRYEDLLADTIGGVHGIYGWLGLPTPDNLSATVDLLSFSSLPEGQRGSGRFARAATPGLWQENLTAEEQKRATEIMGPTLRDLGYPL